MCVYMSVCVSVVFHKKSQKRMFTLSSGLMCLHALSLEVHFISAVRLCFIYLYILLNTSKLWMSSEEISIGQSDQHYKVVSQSSYTPLKDGMTSSIGHGLYLTPPLAHTCIYGWDRRRLIEKILDCCDMTLGSFF